MFRILSTLALAAAAVVLPQALHAESGSIACEREVNQTQMQFGANKGALSAAETHDIEQRLSLGRSYCLTNSYSDARTFIGLDGIRARLDQAQMAQSVQPQNDYQ